ncbi:MAG TPA: undecaprenyl-diphosphate phosphatase [Clostridia bacterium]|nr:undecaprenyl-diphosphate phosphatase [Clostridia bacterium]
MQLIEILKAIILGIVQGLTEFLPVSSSGHLVLVQKIFKIEEVLFLDTMLHAGTLVAVVFYFRKDILDILKKPWCKMTKMLIIGTIPAGLAGLFLEDFIEKSFGGGYLGYGLLITGVIILISARLALGKKTLKDMRYSDSVTIGAAQALAILPGISRSGSTIAAGLMCGFDRSFATRYSMLLSIPVILGSTIFQAKDVLEHGTGDVSFPAIVIGTIAAAVSGFFAINVLMKVLKRGKFKIFAFYVLILGILVLIDQFFLNIIF